VLGYVDKFVPNWQLHITRRRISYTALSTYLHSITSYGAGGYDWNRKL